MLFAVFIVHQRIFLQFFTHRIVIDENFRSWLGIHHQFQDIQQLAGIPATKGNQSFLFLDNDILFFQIKICRNRTVYQAFQIGFFLRFQDIYLTTGQ